MALGDHLLISWGAYHHHAVDAGDGTVIQYGSGLGTGSIPVVEQVSISSWPAGRKIHVVSEVARFAPEQILDRARSRLGERDYCLLTNNCEHFVRWCRLGVARSDQSESARKRLVSSLGRTACRQVVRCASRRWAAPLASRALRGGGWLLLADGAQWVTELAARERGQDVPRARRIAQVAGAGVAVGVGTCLAGPVGAAIGLGSWVSGELIQSYAVSGRE